MLDKGGRDGGSDDGRRRGKEEEKQEEERETRRREETEQARKRKRGLTLHQSTVRKLHARDHLWVEGYRHHLRYPLHHRTWKWIDIGIEKE